MSKTILSADFVLSMDSDNRIIENGAVCVGGDTILEVGRATEVVAAHPDASHRHLRKRLLMPGLINAHCHSGLLRGTAEGLPLWDWLRLFIDPMHRVLLPHEAEVASWLCYAEALLSGTTTVVDMWRFMDGSARAAQTLGNRVVMVPYLGAAPGFDYFDTLDDNEALIQNWQGKANGRIMPWVGIEHAFYADAAGYARAVDMAKRYRTGLHTHSNETQAEIGEMARRTGLRPIEALERFGLLDPDTVLLAHGVWLDDGEIELLARHKVSVAHNPSSNMKLASGAAPVEKLLAAGVAVGLGSDGEKENNNLDLFEEMKIASLLAKFSRMDASALPSWDVLRMATIHGARAIGQEARLGSLEAGKKADLVAVRLDTPRMTPILTGDLFNLHHNLVHAVQGGDVDITMVDGRIVVDGGVLKTSVLGDLIAAAQAAVPDLFARRAAWLAENQDGAFSPV
ncbi:amidohydrolase [Telmatospirillum sp.]|uniref:amidohydrolase family protein n=1 Tax=Telmatospirillum sp. TaxID=2079197 RepID=UPI002847ED0F|nr:amidohydrolase [Telmatospirillum sp.]MDR3437908.1 amidohydrolase [Telmatospirillum sp.]